MRPLFLACLTWFTSATVLAAGFVPDVTTPETATRPSSFQDIYGAREERPVLLAKKRLRKKKRKKKDGGDEMTAPGGEGGLHAAQEGSSDEPYKWELSLLSDLTLNNQKTGETKTGTADYELSGKALRLLTDSFQLGAALDFGESSYKQDDETNTSRSYVLHLLAKYNFGDLNVDEMIFFVQGGFGIGSESSKNGSAKSEASSTQFGVGFGMQYFVDTNVAFTGEIDYDTGSKKIKDVDEKTSFTTIHVMKLGFSLFL